MHAEFPTATHNHSGCVRDALDSAERYCADKGLRLTDTRRRVLELIWGDHKPVGAYALLEQLGDDGRKAAPPTVYRALDFLLEHGLIHRVASLNAFIGCAHPGEAHDPQLFICERCGHAAELDDPGISRAIARDAKRMDFAIAHETVEISGLCGTCRRNES